jgi:hypothetical protein
VELRAGDRGLIELAEFADLRDDVADLVVRLDRGAQSFVGRVDAEMFVQLVENVLLQRGGKVFDAVLVLFERNIREGDEEFFVLNEVRQLGKMLLKPASAGAGLRAELRVNEVVAALERTLEKTAGIVADAAGHIIGGHIRGGAARGAEANTETAGQIQKDLRHEIAGVAESILSLFLRLPDKSVIGLLQQIVEEEHIF